MTVWPKAFDFKPITTQDALALIAQKGRPLKLSDLVETGRMNSYAVALRKLHLEQKQYFASQGCCQLCTQVGATRDKHCVICPDRVCPKHEAQLYAFGKDDSQLCDVSICYTKENRTELITNDEHNRANGC